MVSINSLKNIYSFGVKGIKGQMLPMIRVPFTLSGKIPQMKKMLTEDVTEFSAPLRYVKPEKTSVQQAFGKNIFASTVPDGSDTVQFYAKLSVQDILKPVKDIRFFCADESDNIETAVCSLGEDGPEFKAMLDSLIKQKKEQISIMSQDETNISDTLWSLMSVQDSAGAKNKNVLNVINKFARNKTALKDINTFIDNLSNPQNSDFLKEIDELEPVLIKLSQNLNITDKDFLSCAHCILKNDAAFSKFFFDNPLFLKAYNSTGLKLPDEDIRLMIKNFNQKLSEDETSALMLYKAESKKINTGELPKQARIVESYLNKQILEEEINVFRGEDYGFVDSVQIGDKTLGDILRANQNSSPEQLKKLIATKLSDYQIIQDRFMSASFDPNLVESGKFGSKIIWNLALPKNTKAACLDMHLPQNAMATETEVLVQKNSQLFITNLQFENNKWYIDAIVIQ